MVAFPGSVSKRFLFARAYRQLRAKTTPPPADAREPLALPAVGIEILRREPALECGFTFRPLGGEHREPGGIAAAPLDDHVVAEDALVAEAEAQRCAARGRVEGIAFPFVTAVAERLESIAGEEILRLGGERGTLQARAEQDVADLDHPHVRPDRHQRSESDGAARRLDNGVEVGIA
jgi:hypothetical protein